MAQISKHGQNQPESAAADSTATGMSGGLPPDPFPDKFPAPEFPAGLEWFNTRGALSLKALRGKVVLLDFWTYCCINCLHLLPELKELEKKYAGKLVVIGVHSGKFDAERDRQNIGEAIRRYKISHPVVNDAQMKIWNLYRVRAWPTVWLIDPEGNAVGYVSGEGTGPILDKAIAALIRYHRARGTLSTEPLDILSPVVSFASTPLAFPGKILFDSGGKRLYVADTGHNRIVVADAEGNLIDVIGCGRSGRRDGGFDAASFNQPQGLALAGSKLYVADTGNHLIRAIDFEARVVTTVAGTGEQGRQRAFHFTPARGTGLNSPWALCLVDDRLYIAMAGAHQIWVYDVARDRIGPYAGTGREDIVDGLVRRAAFAQPSGLATDGSRLYVADSEGSSIRAVSLGERAQVRTLVGTAHLPSARLFTFGDRDGDGRTARLQHPLGITYGEGKLFVADTYNNKIKLIEVASDQCRTLFGTGKAGLSDNPATFNEPGGLSYGAGKLYIADTNNHAIRVADLKNGSVRTMRIKGLKPPAAE